MCVFASSFSNHLVMSGVAVFCVGAHLFKSCWEADAYPVLNMVPKQERERAVDHPRNGMLMFRAFELMYDEFRLVFVKCGDSTGEIVIIDEGLKSMTVRSTYACSLVSQHHGLRSYQIQYGTIVSLLAKL